MGSITTLCAHKSIHTAEHGQLPEVLYAGCAVDPQGHCSKLTCLKYKQSLLVNNIKKYCYKRILQKKKKTNLDYFLMFPS